MCPLGSRRKVANVPAWKQANIEVAQWRDTKSTQSAWKQDRLTCLPRSRKTKMANMPAWKQEDTEVLVLKWCSRLLWSVWKTNALLCVLKNIFEFVWRPTTEYPMFNLGLTCGVVFIYYPRKKTRAKHEYMWQGSTKY